MLETDEVDDDYFTPVASTSLANIFGKITVTDDRSDNETLKYIAPKSQNVDQKSEESKTTSCIFACALFGYEWFNNVYTAKGKLGFAIIKTASHNIVLYDSNKTTLSCTLISPKLEMTIRGNIFISYYDNLQKYWSIYGTEDEIKKVVEILKTFDIVIKHYPYTDTRPPEPCNVDKTNSNLDLEKHNRKDVESDTDSSINRTKVSILNRMASMGHSVLPSQTVSAVKTSDSSDTNDTENHNKTIRHKTGKSIVKRNNSEKVVPAVSQKILDTHKKIILPRIEQSENKNMATYTYGSEQLMPLTSTSMITTSSSNSGYDMSFFISEQRISNSELRINMNRATDKVDQILDKINNLESKHDNIATKNLQAEILQKLLSEYENKIKLYEDLLRTRSVADIKLNPDNTSITDTLEKNPVEILKNKIADFEEIIKGKNDYISMLHNEVKHLKDTKETHIKTQNEENLLKKILDLEQDLLVKNEELTNLKKIIETKSLKQSDCDSDIGDKVKNIMNNTFRAISVNFENQEMYSGESIKSVIAMVIKKVTIESLNEV